MKLYNTKQAAFFLGVDPVRLKQARMKAPPWFKDENGRVFYKLEDLKKFKAENKKKGK